MEVLMGEMDSKYESILSMMARMSGQKGEPKEKQQIRSFIPIAFSEGHLTPRGWATMRHSSSAEKGKIKEAIKLPKIDFPYFNEERPREWITKARKYFQIHQVPDEVRISIVEMYLKGNQMCGSMASLVATHMLIGPYFPLRFVGDLLKLQQRRM